MRNEQSLVAFGVYLRKLCESQEISMQQLADEADIFKVTIYRIENAKLNPILDMLISLAKGLNIGLLELVGFVG